MTISWKRHVKSRCALPSLLPSVGRTLKALRPWGGDKEPQDGRNCVPVSPHGVELPADQERQYKTVRE